MAHKEGQIKPLCGVVSDKGAADQNEGIQRVSGHSPPFLVIDLRSRVTTVVLVPLEWLMVWLEVR